jgi:hypothetical protein
MNVVVIAPINTVLRDGKFFTIYDSQPEDLPV